MYYFKDQLSQNVQIKEILGERNLVFLMYLEKKKRNRRMDLFSIHGHLEFFLSTYPSAPQMKITQSH